MTVIAVLKRFEIEVFTRTSPTDAAQVPASASVAFYGQGATSENNTIELLNGFAYDGLIPYGPGSFDPAPLQNDAYVDADPSAHCLVSMNPIDLTLNVTNVSGHTLYISRGVRLWNFGKSLTAYANPLGTGSGVTVTTNPNTGRAYCYLREYRYDYIVTIAGEAPRLFVDAVGSFVMR